MVRVALAPYLQSDVELMSLSMPDSADNVQQAQKKKKKKKEKKRKKKTKGTIHKLADPCL